MIAQIQVKCTTYNSKNKTEKNSFIYHNYNPIQFIIHHGRLWLSRSVHRKKDRK